MRYLSKDEILLLHSMIIDETGGRHGIRDRHAILSLVELPKQKVFGKILYPGIFLRAAVYARNIINFHPFIDGNKRTGMIVADVFLGENGYRLVVKKGEIEKFVLKIATKKPDLKTIAEWLKKHSKKIRKNK